MYDRSHSISHSPASETQLTTALRRAGYRVASGALLASLVLLSQKYCIKLLQIAQGSLDVLQFDGGKIPEPCSQFVVGNFKRGKIGIGC